MNPSVGTHLAPPPKRARAVCLLRRDIRRLARRFLPLHRPPPPVRALAGRTDPSASHSSSSRSYAVGSSRAGRPRPHGTPCGLSAASLCERGATSCPASSWVSRADDTPFPRFGGAFI